MSSQDVHSISRGAELYVRAHPLLQATLARQLGDIDDLKLDVSNPVPAVAARMRAQAAADAWRFLRS